MTVHAVDLEPVAVVDARNGRRRRNRLGEVARHLVVAHDQLLELAEGVPHDRRDRALAHDRQELPELGDVHGAPRSADANDGGVHRRLPVRAGTGLPIVVRRVVHASRDQDRATVAVAEHLEAVGDTLYVLPPRLVVALSVSSEVLVAHPPEVYECSNNKSKSRRS